MLRVLPRTAGVAALLAGGLITAGCDVNVGNGQFHLGLSSGRASDEWTSSYPVTPGASFRLRNANGGITVDASDGSTIEVRAERLVRASSDEAAAELLKKIEVIESRADNGIQLEMRVPKSGMRERLEVKYSLKVPASVALDVRTENGGIRLNGLSGDVVAGSVNGGITGERLSGRVEASTTNGGVTISLGTLSSGVKLGTVNGGIQLELPREARADISARVVNGRVDVGELPIETTGEQSRRVVQGRLNGGGTPVEISTTNGAIRIRGT